MSELAMIAKIALHALHQITFSLCNMGEANNRNPKN